MTGIKTLEVQKAQKIQRPTTWDRFKSKLGYGVVVAVSAATAVSANAAIDTADVVTEIQGLAAPIAAIGAATLIIMVGIKGWKLIRRAM